MAEETAEKTNKLKAFFQNKVVIIIAFILIALGVAALLVAGISAESVSSFVSLIAGVISAIGLVVSAICAAVKAKS